MLGRDIFCWCTDADIVVGMYSVVCPMKDSGLIELCTCCFANCQPNPNEGIAAGHGRCHNGDQPELIQVGDLTEKDLKRPKYEQERIV